MKKFFEEFKKFIQRGNVIDLAVGVIIGGAFSKITSSLVNDIIMPLITAIFGLFGVKGGVAGMSLVLNGVDKYVMDQSTNKLVLNPEAILWNYGNFIQTVLDFLLIALVLFCIIKAINAAKDGLKKGEQDISLHQGRIACFPQARQNPSRNQGFGRSKTCRTCRGS